ncbi:polyphosphate kinase 1 [Mucilaginibacter glaciei]|uniref:Polyphosphate kinase n=1 Tax=Mucilaginibacter glaciei TaxID=2772109 RepID=A0A926S4E4_9SPHI|nr:polyphosphate kinase 1 [Mucilaginibacter glaciei]MBD1391706.1 polyphosphate kinase 1 [Mucilaginibacter glaciei]
MLPQYFNRDLSWLTFNERVLDEAANAQVPLLDRIKFLSIYSSNLDEFYRVRMPVLRALTKVGQKKNNDIDADEHAGALDNAGNMILAQQQKFGQILTREILPQLKANNIHLLYNEPLPDALLDRVTGYFLTEVLAFLQPLALNDQTKFFPENNKLYYVVQLQDAGKEKLVLLNIPSDELPRFYTANAGDEQVVIFLDDILRFSLDKLFKNAVIENCYSIKITRDAELDLKDEYKDDLAEQLETQLNKRDMGLATRFLYQADMPLRILQQIIQFLDLQNATTVQGGHYHNLKDFAAFPVEDNALLFQRWPATSSGITVTEPLVSTIVKKDMLVSTPYQSYDTVLRFFNEAANNPDVEEINVTLYRVASNSRIVNALISAAKNGKQVRVLVELKARFDEANNLKWAKRMKAAGVQIIYSVTALKVHAKVALVKTRQGNRIKYSGLLATGNFNEGTAKFYTDHILFTTNPKLLREVELLFIFLARREKPSSANQIKFKHLLVAQFNLQSRFLELIDREIRNAKNGLPSGITIKMNNLEERVLIDKLYEASQAGVKVALIIRSICCLVPGVKDLSENITIKRIVDRYLEHGRVFLFNNNNDTQVFMGSADWMNRNIYNRIEVCFPIFDIAVKQQLIQMIELQLADNVQAVIIDSQLNQLKPAIDDKAIQSQKEIYSLLNN